MFELSAASSLNGNHSGAAGTLVLTNTASGTLRNAGGTNSFSAGMTVHNQGAVQVTAGTLELGGNGGTHTGSFATAVGTTLEFGGGNHNLNNASAVELLGAAPRQRFRHYGKRNGTLTSGGLLQVTAGTLNAGGAINTVTYTQGGGTLSGASNLTVSGATLLAGGVMTGSGSTITQGLLTINNSTGLDAGRVLDVQGGASSTAGTINLNNSATAGSGRIVNQAGSTFTTDFDGLLHATNHTGDIGADALFSNLGTFHKTGDAGTTTVQNLRFDNSNAVEVDSGTLNLTNGGTHTGSFATAAGTTLQFGGGIHDLNNASAVDSLGRLLVSGGTVNTSGTLTASGLLQITNGTLNAGGTVNAATYDQSGGTLNATE